MNDTELNSYILDLERMDRGDWDRIPYSHLRPARVLALAREVEILRRVVGHVWSGSSVEDLMPGDSSDTYLTMDEAWRAGYQYRQWEEMRWISAARQNARRMWEG
jgi:hypothetical protein